MTRIDLSNLEDGQDVWMVQRRGRSRFLLKASHPLVIPGETNRQYLDRDFATQAHIFGQVNVAHSAGANVVENLVWPKRLANKRSSFQVCQRVSHQFEGRGFNEVAGLLIRTNERFNIATQRFVVSAGFGQKSRALIGFTLKSGLQESFDLLPTFRLHRAQYSYLARDRATLWPCSTRA